jgi:hypothetical protein
VAAAAASAAAAVAAAEMSRWVACPCMTSCRWLTATVVLLIDGCADSCLLSKLALHFWLCRSSAPCSSHSVLRLQASEMRHFAGRMWACAGCPHQRGQTAFNGYRRSCWYSAVGVSESHWHLAQVLLCYCADCDVDAARSSCHKNV